jgi:hypothetical protein
MPPPHVLCRPFNIAAVNTTSTLIQILLVLTVAALCVCIFLKVTAIRKGGRIMHDDADQPHLDIEYGLSEIPPERRFLASLGSVERDLVLALAETSVKEGRMEVRILNQMLGLSANANDIQKVHRSRVINHINSRYQSETGSGTTLVQRERDDEDGRMFRYFIEAAVARAILDERDHLG